MQRPDVAVQLNERRSLPCSCSGVGGPAGLVVSGWPSHCKWGVQGGGSPLPGRVEVRGGCGKRLAPVVWVLQAVASAHAFNCERFSDRAPIEAPGGGGVQTQKTKRRYLPLQPFAPRGAEIAFSPGRRDSHSGRRGLRGGCG